MAAKTIDTDGVRRRSLNGRHNSSNTFRPHSYFWVTRNSFSNRFDATTATISRYDRAREEQRRRRSDGRIADPNGRWETPARFNLRAESGRPFAGGRAFSKMIRRRRECNDGSRFLVRFPGALSRAPATAYSDRCWPTTWRTTPGKTS